MDLKAPLMAFGTVAIDRTRKTNVLPGRSMLTGMIGNALGWKWQDWDKLARLQERLQYAAGEMRKGERVWDYQIHSFHPKDKAWTTAGIPEERGGSDSNRTEPRNLEYIANGHVRVALRLEKADEAPGVEDVMKALQTSARTLYIGRKTCIPSMPVARGITQAEDCIAALCQEGLAEHAQVHWTENTDHELVRFNRSTREADNKNWRSRLHGGENTVHHGTWSGETHG